MFKRIIVKIRKYISDKFISFENERLIREKAAIQEEFDSYARDAGTAMDLLCEDKRVLQEKVKKLEQESKYFAADRDTIAKRYEEYIHKLKTDFEKRESELMDMFAKAEARLRISEHRFKALDEEITYYINDAVYEHINNANKRSEDDLK